MASPWPGDTPAAWIDDIGNAIADRYRDIEDQLRERLERHLAQHLDAPDDLRARLAAIQDLREQAERLVKEVDPAVLARWATEEAAMGASAEITRTLLNFPAYNAGGVAQLTAAGGYAVAAIELELRDALRKLNERVLRAPVDAYQAMTAKHIGSLLGGATTQRALHRRLLDLYLADGLTGFVDKSGRRWTIGAYSEMATRTAAARAWRDQSVASMEAAGIATFTPVIGASACGKCGQWQGKVITDGGPTGTITVPHAITGEPTELVVHATLDEMRASGWGHPNCRCTLVPGLPGGPDPTQYSTHDPQAQADREELRRLEREVRAAKRDGNTDEIGAAQAELRQHVRQTGIQRRGYREQLPFADGGDTNPRGRTTPTPPPGPRGDQDWAQRQRRLGFQSGPGWDLEPHEVRFYETLLDQGERMRPIRRSFTGTPTNDFRWLSRGGIEVEVKATKATYQAASNQIRGATSRARRQGVAKENFIIDLADRRLSEKLAIQLGRYNVRNPENQIRRLWVLTEGQLVPIDLGAKK